MKVFTIISLLVISLMSQAQQEKPDTNFHLYLLIGQSNMAGRGALDEESKKTNPQIWMLDSNNRWVLATDPVHFDKPSLIGVGPAISFAKEMLGDNKKTRIGLIPGAVGGSPISVWEPGAFYAPSFHPYDDAMKRLQSAMQKGVLKGIIWHQGESDNDSIHAPLYLEKLKTLINRLRTETHQPNLPFVAGEIGYFIKEDFINRIINQLPQKVPHAAVVSAKNLTDKGDHLHFDTPSARELGKRYAEAMKKMQKSN
jgi:hypothetical protein